MKKLPLIIATLFMIVGSARAQELGISPTKVWSGNNEMQDPLGLSIFLQQPLWRIAVRVEYTTASNQRSYHGIVAGGFLRSREAYVFEDVSSKSIYRTIEFSITVPRLLNLRILDLNAGIGVSLDKFDCNRSGLQTGNEVSLFDDKKTGVFYSVSVSRDRIFRTALKLSLRYKDKALMSGVYPTDTDMPFINLNNMRELQLGLSWLF